MKTTLIVMLVIILYVSLSADEPSFKEKIERANEYWKILSYELYISPGVVPDVGIGINQRLKLNKSYNESSFLLHADLIPSVWELERGIKDFYKIELWGFKFKSTYFYKPDYSGFNWFFNVGFQAIYIDLGLDSGGSSPSDPSWIPFPDLAVGCGYSWKLDNGNYLRISQDVGIKIFVSNLYLSYVW